VAADAAQQPCRFCFIEYLRVEERAQNISGLLTRHLKVVHDAGCPRDLRLWSGGRPQSLTDPMAATATVPPRPEPAIERASATDRAFLAMDAGQVPEQLAVILVLEQTDGLDLQRVRELIAGRLPVVPRLRQRLVRARLGCGGPVWADDPRFDLGMHVRAIECPEPGDERALLDVALPLITTRLPLTAPLWAATLVTGLADGCAGLVIVLHHAMADGVGGLAVLASLVDGAPTTQAASFPRPAPATADLAREAFTTRLRALREIRRSWRLLRVSMTAGGGLRPPRAEPCSLNQQIGPRRCMAVVRANASALRAAAHEHGATTNDAILVAVSAALGQVLATRGESVDTIVLTIPVSGRRSATAESLGNKVSPLLVAVPTAGDQNDRLRQVATYVRAHKADAMAPPPIAVLGWLFRPLAALGGYRWYMRHQRRLHSLVSHVRGPAELLTFGGCPIVSAIPVSVGEAGNCTVYFQVLSYAGTIVISVLTDPDHFPELDALAVALRTELSGIGQRR
jgi:diacylglycerol O-acyltransferase / wax synthase